MKKKTNKKKTLLQNEIFLKKIAQLSVDDTFTTLESNKEGLTEEQVELKYEKYDKNIIVNDRFYWYKHLFAAIANPFIGILLVITIYNFLNYFVFNKYQDITDLFGAALVILMIFISIFITYFLDYRSFRSAKKLKQMVETTVSVIRYNEKRKNKKINYHDLSTIAKYTEEIKIEDLLPGDIIFLSSGDMIPSDVRILNATDLFLNQSTLTGESLPVEKNAKALTEAEIKGLGVLELPNLAFMGTSVVSGAAVAMVVNIGRDTYFGYIANFINRKKGDNSFNNGIRKISLVIIIFMACMVPTIFLINYLLKDNLLQSILFAMSVAVGITPEMFPLIISANLIHGANKLSKKKVIVKNLNTIQSFGAMDILCTDKTGTLTKDKIELVKYIDLNGDTNLKILELAFLNSFFQTGIKNNIDKTIKNFWMQAQPKFRKQGYKKIDEIPFDFTRRRLSVIVQEPKKNGNLLICKGAIEEILKISKQIEVNGEIMDINNAIEKQILNLSRTLNQEGMRVIAIAYNRFDKNKKIYHELDENDLIITGFLTFLDMPKKSAIKAIKVLSSRGVAVKILTGDNEIVTKAICEKVGLEPGIPLLGVELDKIADETTLHDIVDKTVIFAKMSPLQKAKIIDVLKKKKHTVGFLGDGVNDVVALRNADIGISVNSASDIAKEASDIVLLEKDLMVLETGVMIGRRTFVNMMKYIKIGIASNFGNTLSFLIGSIFVPFIILLPVQILLQNFLYDLSQLAVPFDNVDKDLLKRPHKWETKSIVPFTIWNGITSSFFDIAMFIFLGLGLGLFQQFLAGDTTAADQFRTGWFILGIISQTLVVLILRTAKMPFIKSFPSLQLLISAIILIIIGVALPFIPGINAIFDFKTPDPLPYFFFLFIIVLFYAVISQLSKTIYIKIFKKWI